MAHRTMIAFMATGLSWCMVQASQPAGEASLAPEDIVKMAKTMGEGDQSKKEKSPFPDFEKVTKDMVSDKGLFTLWSYPPGTKDKDSQKLLCQIPSGFLGEKFMLSTSFSGGGFFTGFPLEEGVVKWELHNKHLLLIEPETGHVVENGKTVSDVVKRTYPDRIRAAVAIVTKTSSGDPVIDLGRLLKSNFINIGWMSGGMGPFGGGGGGGSINRALSSWTKKKVFDLNVEIGVELAMSRRTPPGSYDKKMVHYSFWKLPKSSYSPRVADDRVGYFLTTNQDWAKPTESRDLFNRFINRWHLEKRDSDLALCEPKQPIIYYIEKTVPVRFRRAVRDGILDWNKAFEKIGFLNAIEVRQQTNDNEWKDLDPEDMRYSFFRWIVTGAGFAMGPSRANPFTGQIYDADIIFDDSMVRFFERSAERSLPSALMASMMDDPVLRGFVDKYPQFKRPERGWESYSFGEPNLEEARATLRDYMHMRGSVGCTLAEGMKHQLALANAMLATAPDKVREEFLYDVIKEVVSHEIGHTLGLRHNFKASTIYSVEDLEERRQTGEALAGSVMDYNPALFFKNNTLDGHFITPTIGPYDYWAIEYGYRLADGTYVPPGSETEDNSDDEAEEKVAQETNGERAAELTSKIPAEILEKLPPEIRKLIEAETAKAMTSASKPEGKSDKPKAKSPSSGEEGMLKAIASRAAEPLLAYSTDEDTTFISPDPRSNRFDAGAEPIDWARTRMDLINDRLANILDWAVKDEESWYHMRSTFISLMFERARVLGYVGRYIGGQYTSRSHRGDPDAPPPFELIDPDVQRRALKFIEDHLFQEDFFEVSPEVLNHLTAHRWWHEGTRIDFRVDFPMHDFVAIMQWMNLFERMFPNTLRRIHDAEFKTSLDDKFTVAEYIQRIQSACWADAVDKKRVAKGEWKDASPFISSIRRSLQREYLNVIEPLVRTKPGLVISPDIHAMVQFSLQELKDGIEGSLSSGELDFASKAHLSACKARIEQMLSPELREYDF